MTTILFWLFLACLFYIYLGYPITIFFVAQLLNKTPFKNKVYPSVGIVIAAYNEEKFIRNTIENKLSLNYPREKFSIYVISDASNDSTDTSSSTTTTSTTTNDLTSYPADTSSSDGTDDTEGDEEDTTSKKKPLPCCASSAILIGLVGLLAIKAKI